MQIALTGGHHIFLSNETRVAGPLGKLSSRDRQALGLTSVPVNAEASAVMCQKHELCFSLGFRDIFLCQNQGLGAAGKACGFPRPGRKQLAALQLWAWISGKTFSRPDSSLSTGRCPSSQLAQPLQASGCAQCRPTRKGLCWEGHGGYKWLFLCQINPFFPSH